MMRQFSARMKPGAKGRKRILGPAHEFRRAFLISVILLRQHPTLGSAQTGNSHPTRKTPKKSLCTISNRTGPMVIKSPRVLVKILLKTLPEVIRRERRQDHDLLSRRFPKDRFRKHRLS